MKKNSSMNEYARSLCSTCSHRSDCSLSKERTNINLCNEYRHYLEDNKEPIVVVSDEMY